MFATVAPKVHLERIDAALLDELVDVLVDGLHKFIRRAASHVVGRVPQTSIIGIVLEAARALIDEAMPQERPIIFAQLLVAPRSFLPPLHHFVVGPPVGVEPPFQNESLLRSGIQTDATNANWRRTFGFVEATFFVCAGYFKLISVESIGDVGKLEEFISMRRNRRRSLGSRNGVPGTGAVLAKRSQSSRVSGEP